MLAPFTATVYRIANLGGLIIGHTIAPLSDSGPKSIMNRSISQKHSKEWSLAPGIYTPRQVVAGVSPLLETVVVKLGKDPVSSRKVLVDGLAASLSTTSRESTLPLPKSVTDASRKEMAKQANQIGETLVQYVREASTPDQGSDIMVRSPCEGHLWTHAVTGILMGPRSNGQLMQLYNEWLHQLVLLRDSLLPFQNYADVALSIQGKTGAGLRDFEEPRSKFLVQCLTRAPSQVAIVDLAKAFTAPALPSGGYGLQHSQGLILPAFLSGCSSLHLLRYHPARLIDSSSEVLFDYEYASYYSAPRTELPKSAETITAGSWPPASLLTLTPELTECSVSVHTPETENGKGKDQPRRLLKLQLDLDKDACVSVDLGQIARGRRYVYQVSHKASTTSTSAKGFSKISALHRPADILSQPGLVSSETEGIHVIPATNPVLGLALLGKLYPENVILLGAEQAPGEAEMVGKGFGPRFVIYGGRCEEGQQTVL
ncbi:hypothetical protein MMC16_006972 [Acarospora aff. strigata]|nr:hypothetical protein [Acarospora aff. strigata]